MTSEKHPVRKAVRNLSGIPESAESPSGQTFPYAPRRGARGNAGGFPGQSSGKNRPESRPEKAVRPEARPESSGISRRFDGWLAGASAEQQARWERMQAGAKVEDETLPPALRGGALGAF